MRNLNPPRVVATWAVENYWAEEYALARALVDKIVADAKRALDSIPDRVPYPSDDEVRPPRRRGWRGPPRGDSRRVLAALRRRAVLAAVAARAALT